MQCTCDTSTVTLTDKVSSMCDTCFRLHEAVKFALSRCESCCLDDKRDTYRVLSEVKYQVWKAVLKP